MKNIDLWDDAVAERQCQQKAFSHCGHKILPISTKLEECVRPQKVRWTEESNELTVLWDSSPQITAGHIREWRRMKAVPLFQIEQPSAQINVCNVDLMREGLQQKKSDLKSSMSRRILDL